MKKNYLKSKKFYLLAGVVALLVLLAVLGSWAIKQRYKFSLEKNPQKEKTEFMFVQTASSGTLTPIPGKEGAFELVLNDVVPYTTYFSDRPERVAGLAPMEKFIKGFNWGQKGNPPNAALVISDAPENEGVMVITLAKPNYDTENNVLKYSAKTLKDKGSGSERFYKWFASRQNKNIPSSFNHVALFIDDCPDTKCTCLTLGGQVFCGGAISGGCCWEWSAFECKQCSGTQDKVNQKCNSQFPSCCQQGATRGCAGVCMPCLPE